MMEPIRFTNFVGSTAGTTSASVALPAGVQPNNLIVIDFVMGTVTGGTVTAWSLAIAGVTVVNRVTGSGVGDNIFMAFPTGYPLWSSQSSDAAPLGLSSVVVTAANAGSSVCQVGWHYESPTIRRTA